MQFGVPGTFNLSKTSLSHQTRGFRKGIGRDSLTLKPKKYLLRIVESGTKLIYSKEVCLVILKAE